MGGHRSQVCLSHAWVLVEVALILGFLNRSSVFFFSSPNLAKRWKLRKVGEAPVTSAASAHCSAEEQLVDRSSPPLEERREEDMEEERATSPVRQPASPMELEEAMEEESAKAARTNAGSDEPELAAPAGAGGEAGADELLPEA